MQIVNKDILTVERGLIFSQVNCQKIMAAGLAAQIRLKWPVVYDEYIKYSDNWQNDFQRLGKYQVIKVDTELFVVNCFGQLNYGRNGRFTDYGSLNNIFKLMSTPKENWLYFPYGMGAGLGGGDWNIIVRMIEFYFPNAIICKYDN